MWSQGTAGDRIRRGLFSLAVPGHDRLSGCETCRKWSQLSLDIGMPMTGSGHKRPNGKVERELESWVPSVRFYPLGLLNRQSTHLGQSRLGAMTADLWSHRQCPVSDGFATRIGSADKAKLIQAKNMQFTLWVLVVWKRAAPDQWGWNWSRHGDFQRLGT